MSLARLGRSLTCAAVVLAIGCGARSMLKDKKGASDADPKPCKVNADCVPTDRCQPLICDEGFCQPGIAVTCDDSDPCTEDLCDPTTGDCLFRPYSYDLDGDGHPGSRPGSLPGAPDSCGDDCNDQAPLAFPGGLEVCDGVDNDCNGVVDDLALFTPLAGSPVRVTGDEFHYAFGASLVYNGKHYGTTYSGTQTKPRAFFKGLSPNGETSLAQLPLTKVGSDSYAGPIVWTGSIFATAWEDRREHNFEVFFNRLDPEGKKLGPDLRVSYGEDFSLHPDILWNGREFLVVWDDQRDGEPVIMGQRVTLDGQLVGGNVDLTPGSVGEAPLLVQGRTNLVLFFKRGVLSSQTIAFRTVTPDFSELGEVITLSSEGSVGPSAVFSGDRFVVAWSRVGSASQRGDAIWGATVSESGEVLQPEQRITDRALAARFQTLLPLGDRVLLFWGADQGSNYDLFAKMLDLAFVDLTPPSRITTSASDTSGTAATFGPNGDIGILFNDWSSGSPQTYFSRLTCQPNSLQ